MKARERYARKVAARVEAIICNPTCARKCRKCLGFKTIMLTDGTLRECPACKGSGEQT